MKAILRHLELILTFAGLVVIFGATALVHPDGVSSWTVAAITATAVGIIHGILFWVVRRRQRQVRQAALADVEQMLRDVIANQLSVIRLSAHLNRDPASEKTQIAIERLENAVANIHGAISNISEESLATWRTRYRSALEHV